VDLLQHRGGQGSRVPVIIYVLNQRGQPLMPCSARTARILVKKGEAKVVKTNPFFVIQLKKATGEQIQKCSLGIDSGYKYVGFSVITDKKEIVCGELILDDKTSERLRERSMYRRHRRRRLWYRKSRRNNRKASKVKIRGSNVRKFNTHIDFIKSIRKIICINVDSITIETGSFDIQKIENPNITNLQYQQGPMYGYKNMRNFLMARESGKCQMCNKEFSRGDKAHIHHIIPVSSGGTDREKNLSLLHERCHARLHKKKLFNVLNKNNQYKEAGFMNTVRLKYQKILPDCRITYGYETSVKRIELKLKKAHHNDAFVIAGGTNQKRSNPIVLKQKHRNNRILQANNRKGSKPLIRRCRYSIQPGDTLFVENKKYLSRGCHGNGKMVRCTDGNNYLDFYFKRIEKVFHVGSIYLDMPQ
jgi:hypothetical protein